MLRRSFVLLTLAVATLVASLPVGAQTTPPARTTATWRVPRTPDGRPDLQGIWTNASITPLERPRALGDKRQLTEAEAAAFEEQAARSTARVDANLVKGDIGSYNQFWMDSGTKVLPTRQTSLVVDPSDGRVPVRPEAEAKRDENLRRSTDDPELMSVWDQCISRGAPGWIIPAGYNNAYQIVQTPGFVVIHSEMIHDARIIPTTPRPPLPAAVRLLEGDSRGHWEGDTLVVETTHFSDRNWIATSAFSGRIKGVPQSTALRIVERFSRVAADRLDYEARIDDPAVFTQPWTLAFPLLKNDEYQIYEYACHEGNRAVEGILRGARYEERVKSGRAKYPAHWWTSASSVGAPEWEILPQAAGPGEVILSKRHELGLLSNFAPTPFTFRGQRYASLEGFWQMMLYPEGANDPRATFPGLEWKFTREQVAQMSSFEAKSAGTLAEANMSKMGISWVTFEGRRIEYRPKVAGDHYALIVEATREKVRQNPEVARVLLATGDLILKPDHHQEPNAPDAWRYFEILTRIRSELQSSLRD